MPNTNGGDGGGGGDGSNVQKLVLNQNMRRNKGGVKNMQSLNEKNEFHHSMMLIDSKDNRKKTHTQFFMIFA